MFPGLTTLNDLYEVIKQGESDSLEFKKSKASLHSAGETLCGFLNGKGGRVLIGVSLEGKILGQNVSDSTLREIAELIRKFEPPASIDLNRIKMNTDKEVIILTARARGSDIPYAFSGRPYQRIGSTTSQMPQQTYQHLLLERSHSNSRWETEIATGYTLQDFNVSEVTRTIMIGFEVGRIPMVKEGSILSLFEKFGLMRGDHFLNAAVVLFGNRFLPGFTQCQLSLARFKGVDKTEFIDQNHLFGNLFYLLEEAMLFLRRHLPIAGKILPNVLERVDEPLFPMIALREALVNAFCHRTYANSGCGVSVAIFDDRLEIWNDGRLPYGLSPGDLKKDHTSRLRNPLIAQILYNRGLIEKWGRGTQQIVQLCVKAGQPEPEFLELSNSFVVRFLTAPRSAPSRVSHNLSDRQRLILHSISEAFHRGVTFNEVKLKLKDAAADRTLRDDFQHLKRLGLIEVLGRGRGAKWHPIIPVVNRAAE